MNLGGMVRFEFKTPYKLRVLVQQRTLFTQRLVAKFCYLSSMSHAFWEYLVSSPVFAKFPEINCKIILEKMSTTNPAETVSGDDVVSDAVALEVVSMEAPAVVHMAPRSPRPKHTPTREKNPSKPKESLKGKQNKMPVRMSPRKNPKKKDKQPE